MCPKDKKYRDIPNRKQGTGYPIPLSPHTCSIAEAANTALPLTNNRCDLLNNAPKSSIRFLGIDRANAYRATALKHLADVEVCDDAYHWVSNMNKVEDKARRAEMSHPTEAPKRRLKGKRYHLLKAKENLKEGARGELATLQLIPWLKISRGVRGEAGGEVRPGNSGEVP